MNAVEIEQAVSELAEQPFDAAEFPFAFLIAFGNKETVIRRLRSGNNNASDIPGGVLQRQNIHMATCAAGQVAETLRALRESPKTATNKARFILATDGADFQAEDLTSGETVACDYAKFPDHFGFFLPLAGITTVKQIRENAFDIRATSRLNRLYVQLLKDNPEWGAAERRPDMNHFMARLIFCFFAEDTGIFSGEALFTGTVEQMSDRDASNMHEVIETIFRAMNTPVNHDGNPDDRYRNAAGIPRWADRFPYVNGGLFSGDATAPQFSRIARSYFLHIGGLDWTQINPDIFGSMIQAVADDEERGELGMHYTSVPNILKVLNPLFLDDLRAQLEAAGDNPRALLNLRKRMSRIRVFDPACGSGNFLVIAYKEMRAVEAEINRRRGEPERRSDIPLTNFRGIELRDFAAEIARLALVIAGYQADVQHRGHREALAEFLPLDAENWITCGNALRLDWLSVLEPDGAGSIAHSTDLFAPPLNQVAFENAGGETYICGNPPYVGYNRQTQSQKDDIAAVFEGRLQKFGNLDYVACWFAKAAWHNKAVGSKSAFVATNSICQGSQVPVLWPAIFAADQCISFARTSFRWANLATRNAGITVIAVGFQTGPLTTATLFDEVGGEIERREVSRIGPYLVANTDAVINPRRDSISNLPDMTLGNHPYYASELILSAREARDIVAEDARAAGFLRRYLGSSEIISGQPRHCIWIEAGREAEAANVADFGSRFDRVRDLRREKKSDATARVLAEYPYRFRDQGTATRHLIAVPQVSSENRPHLPVDLMPASSVISFQAYALYDAPLWTMAIVCSKIHIVWIGTVCRRMRTDFSYSNTMGWNTFPVPKLTDQNKADLTRCAENILLTREAHWPATIADLYDPDAMPDDLRAAHERNDETLERIYIGRRFRNDTERLEKLFELYTKMTNSNPG